VLRRFGEGAAEFGMFEQLVADGPTAAVVATDCDSIVFALRRLQRMCAGP